MTVSNSFGLKAEHTLTRRDNWQQNKVRTRNHYLRSFKNAIIHWLFRNKLPVDMYCLRRQFLERLQTSTNH